MGEYSQNDSRSRRCEIVSEPVRQRRIDKLPFDRAALEQVATLLGGTLRSANFRLPDADVWRLEVPDEAGAVAVTLTFWPSIRRVDASSPVLTIVMTDIAGVEIVEDVEAVFRRADGGYLIIPKGGKVLVRA